MSTLTFSLYSQVESEFDPDIWTIVNSIIINGEEVVDEGVIRVRTKDGNPRVLVFSQLILQLILEDRWRFIIDPGRKILLINSNDVNEGAKIVLLNVDLVAILTLIIMR